jgi:hypothetical protein
MTQTTERFENSAVSLLKNDTHPLLIERIALCAKMGEILADAERYDSQEWFDVVAALHEATRRIREGGINTSRFYDSSQFPMKHNPAAVVIRGAVANVQSPDIPPAIAHTEVAEAA